MTSDVYSIVFFHVQTDLVAIQVSCCLMTPGLSNDIQCHV